MIIYLVVYIDILKKTLRAGGNVLLPVDTAGRVLELILLLESVSTRHVLLLSFSLFLPLWCYVWINISDLCSCSIGLMKTWTTLYTFLHMLLPAQLITWRVSLSGWVIP